MYPSVSVCSLYLCVYLSVRVCVCPEFPPAVTDAGKRMSAESRRAWLEEKGLILKQTYWYSPKLSLSGYVNTTTLFDNNSVTLLLIGLEFCYYVFVFEN